MRLRAVFAILLNFTAVAVPTATLYRVYGPTAQVNPESVQDMAFLVGSMLFAFVVSLLASTLLRNADRSGMSALMESLAPRPRSAKPPMSLPSGVAAPSD